VLSLNEQICSSSSSKRFGAALIQFLDPIQVDRSILINKSETFLSTVSSIFIILSGLVGQSL
jgi:hypothetical protein